MKENLEMSYLIDILSAYALGSGENKVILSRIQVLERKDRT